MVFVLVRMAHLLKNNPITMIRKIHSVSNVEEKGVWNLTIEDHARGRCAYKGMKPAMGHAQLPIIPLPAETSV